jgi:hypothetical protein
MHTYDWLLQPCQLPSLHSSACQVEVLTSWSTNIRVHYVHVGECAHCLTHWVRVSTAGGSRPCLLTRRTRTGRSQRCSSRRGRQQHSWSARQRTSHQPNPAWLQCSRRWPPCCRPPQGTSLPLASPPAAAAPSAPASPASSQQQWQQPWEPPAGMSPRHPHPARLAGSRWLPWHEPALAHCWARLALAGCRLQES